MNPEFFLRPFDPLRPRAREPRADAVSENGAKTYLLREQNGLVFFRETARDVADWTFALTKPRDETSSLEAQFRGALETGKIARYVLLPFRGEGFTREFPLFLAPDGRGFCREAWNSDDVFFQHELSLHEWLEAPASALLGFCDELFRREIAPQLETMRLPADRNTSLDFHGGARENLGEIVAHILALETSLLAGERIIRATCQTTSPFSRGGFYEVAQGARRVETWFDATNGERFRLPWHVPELSISRRFWILSDWAIDAVTPTGIYWDYHDRGAGRLSESPHARDFSLQFIVSKLPAPAQSLDWLRQWAQPRWPLPTIETVLNDETLAEFAPREREI